MRVDELVKEKDVLKKATINFELLITEKEKKLQESRAKLENTQKNLKMLNSGTNKLDHILSLGKSSDDRHGLRYAGESTTSKIVFVKESPTPEP